MSSGDANTPATLHPVRRLDASAPNFNVLLDDLTVSAATDDEGLEAAVREILRDVRQNGDRALVDYTSRFDARELHAATELRVTAEQMAAAYDQLDGKLKEALCVAAERIREFHQRQLQQSWHYTDALGNQLGQQVTALASVGIYVPGGRAAYPSSVLMNAIPAKVAGVEKVVMVSPAPGGELNPVVLAAAQLAGVTEFFTVGGAQAVAALTYGTELLPQVDKIVGPGNRYVACAKRLVFGQVGLDMVAGPSEILIICDGKTDPDWVAMDLFSQAEHDEDAQSILLSPDAAYFDAVEASMRKLLPALDRRAIISESINRRAAFIVVESLARAVEVSNRVAPEHLELSVDNPSQYLSAVRNAGAIFMGRYTPEAFGDYCAGPNHVLPTSSTARYASPLGVYDFQKRSSVIHCSQQSARELAGTASVIAQSESLTAHQLSAEFRVDRN